MNQWLLEAVQSWLHIGTRVPTHRSEALEKSAHAILCDKLAGTVEETRVGALRSSLEVRLDDIGWNSDTPH